MSLRSTQRRLLIVFIALLAGCTLNSAPSNQVVSGEPVVRIVSPQPNATYLEGVVVNIQATVSNAGADIDRVEVVVDGTTAATLPTPNAEGAEMFNVTHGWSAAGIGIHTIGITAFRADGTSSAPASVEITVVDASGQTGSAATNAPNVTQNSTNASARPTSASSNLQPTAPPTTAAATAVPQQPATPTSPTASFQQGINVRRGPGLEFDPPIGAFTAGQSTAILAINPAGSWYKVRFGSGEGWVFAALTDASGDVAALPRESGPPVPTAAPPTAVPPTNVPAPPASNVNLVAGIVELNPGQPTCQQTFNIGLDVANLGSAASNASGGVSVTDVRSSDGSTQQITTGGFPVLQPQQTFRVNMPLTVSTWYNEEHTIILIIDPQNEIPETEEGDNRREVRYTLQKGGC